MGRGTTALRDVQADVEEVCDGQRQENAGQQPQRERGPKYAVDEDKDIGNLDGDLNRPNRNGRHKSQRQNFVYDGTPFEQQRQNLDGFRTAEQGAQGLRAIRHP